MTSSYETTVDVYAYPVSGGAKRYLGSAGPGTQRFPLMEPVGYVFAEAGGRPVTGGKASRGVPGSISFSRQCTKRD
ncbi:MAG: hypothetical protein ABI910_03420 [Gemmatimonadota bacterium]